MVKVKKSNPNWLVEQRGKQQIDAAFKKLNKATTEFLRTQQGVICSLRSDGSSIKRISELLGCSEYHVKSVLGL